MLYEGKALLGWMMAEVNVLVVGAGPTGLMMAAELVRHGLTCRIIDKATAPSSKSKAIILQARTLEVFDHIGIANLFLSEGLILHAANPISNGRPLAHLCFDHLNSPYPFAFSLEQNKTEQILTKHLASLGVKVERAVELLSLQQDEKGVKAILLHSASGKKEQVQASWIVGCDGAHSIVRKTSNLPFKGRVFSDIFSLADVHVHWKYLHDELFAFLGAQGVLAAVPLPGKNRYRLIFQLERCRNLLNKKNAWGQNILDTDAIPDPTMEETQALLRKYVGPEVTVTDPVWMANFHVNSRMVSTYRENRVFLVGDAAHIHSPVGGQGMNTGLQDAFNLAWKLALVHRNEALPSLLDTYTLERHSVGKQLLKFTELATYVATFHNPLLIALRNLMISWLTRRPAIRKRIVSAISQTAICYPKSCISYQSGSFHCGPKAGMRAPNALVCSKDIKTHFYALWRNTTCYYLILFSGPKASQKTISRLAEIASRLASRYPNKVTPYLIVDSSTAPEIAGLQIFTDPSGAAHVIYGIKKASAYIIRPDTYVGYRNNAAEFSLEEYFRHLFV